MRAKEQTTRMSNPHAHSRDTPPAKVAVAAAGFLKHAKVVGLLTLVTGARGFAGSHLVDRLLPRDDRWTHRHGSAGHGADHVLPAIVAPTIVLPVQHGEPLLGVWQSVVFVDLNRDNPRRNVRLSFVAG